jgi:hypothetical protein
MARRGRDLERLAAFLEKSLGPKGIQVTSSDFIGGKVSKSKREIDVSLRSRVGSTEVLVIMECRDRVEIEDVTWIEQIAKKMEDVSADKAVAVTSVGFTSGAVNAAKMYNIELRTFEEINPEEVLLWFEMKDFEIHKQRCNLLRCEIHLRGEISELPKEFIAKVTPPMNIRLPIFRRKKDGQLISLENLWNSLPQQEVFSNIGEQKKVRRLHINLTGEGILQIPNSPDPLEIDYVDIVAELWIEVEKKPLKSVKFYKEEDKVIAKTADFEAFECMGKELIFGLHQFPETGEQIVSLRLKEEPAKRDEQENE